MQKMNFKITEKEPNNTQFTNYNNVTENKNKVKKDDKIEQENTDENNSSSKRGKDKAINIDLKKNIIQDIINNNGKLNIKKTKNSFKSVYTYKNKSPNYYFFSVKIDLNARV